MPIEQYPYFPRFSTYLPDYTPGEKSPAATPAPEIPATGTGDWLTSGLSAGGYGAASEFGRALQAASQFVGAPGAAQTFSDFAQRMHERERAVTRPDIESNPWSLPWVGYQVARMVPMGVAAIGGGMAAAAAAPELTGAAILGGAAATYPFVTGANVERQISETGQLTTPGKALALGVPEAFAQAALPGRLASIAEKGLLGAVGHGFITQVGAGGVTEALTQMMGDPNRSFADRANAVIESAFTAGALGGITGAGAHGYRALVGKPTRRITTEDLDRATDPAAMAPEAGAPSAIAAAEQLELPLPRVPGKDLGELPLFGGKPIEEPVAPALELPRVPGKDIGELPLFGGRPAEAVPPAEAAAVPPEVPATPVIEPLVPPTWETPERAAQREQQAAQSTAALDTLRQTLDETRTKPTEPFNRQAFIEATSKSPEAAAEYARRTGMSDEQLKTEIAAARDNDPRTSQAAYEKTKAAMVSLSAEPPTVAEVAPVVPALNFTAKISEPALKKQLEMVKGLPDDVQADLAAQVIDKILELPGQQKPTGPLRRWAKGLDLLDEKGFLRDELVPERPVETPPGIEPEKVAVVAPFKVGDSVHIEMNGTLMTKTPVRITDIQQAPDGVRYYKTEGSDSYVPEHNIIAPEPAPTAPPASPGERLNYASAGATRRQRGTLGEPAEAPPEAALPGEGIKKAVGDRVMMPPDEGGAPAPHEVVEFTKDGKVTVKDPDGRLIPGLQQAYVNARPFAPITAEPAPPAASVAPIKTVEDRAAALDNIMSHIEALPLGSDAQKQFTAEAQTIMKLLPNVETNPGLGSSLNVRLTRLRNRVEEANARPPDAVASPDLKPSPAAEAVPASTVDFSTAMEAAQDALQALRSKARGGLGTHPDAPEALKAHEEWLAKINKATSPEELQELLAKDPERDPNGDNLSNLTKISKPMRDNLDAYDNAKQQLTDAIEGKDSRARVVTSRDGLSVTQLDADVTSLHQRGASLSDVADHIIQHTPDAETAEIVAKLKPFLPKDATTAFRDGVTNKEGEYFTKQKISTLYNAADAATTSVHEMVHAVMHRAMEGDSAAAKTMRGIYDQLKNKGDHAGITDAHEMVAEAMANPTYREFLKSQMVKGTSLWDRIVDTVRGFIGLEPRLYNAFDRIMSHGDDLMREQREYPNEWLGPDSYARVTNKATGTAAAAANTADRSLSEKLFNGSLNVRQFIRNVVNGWSPGQWLARNPEFNKLSENIGNYVNSLSAEDPRKKQIGKAAEVANRQSSALSEEGKDLLNQTMAASTSYGFHPDQGLAPYAEDIRGNPTRVGQFQVVEKLWGLLGQIPGGREAFNTWRSVMSMLGHMTAVHNLQAIERTIPGLAAEDSFRKFDTRADLTNQPKLGEDFWRAELNNKIKTNTDYRDSLSAEKIKLDDMIATKQAAAKIAGTKLGDQLAEPLDRSRKLGSQIETLSEAIKLAEGEQKRMLKEPYFHLGRKGDFFATGKLITTPGAVDPETGKPGKPIVDQAVLEKFVDHLQKNGINDVAIMQGNQHGTFYTRVETPAQLAALETVMRAAQTAGLLSKDGMSTGKIFDPHIFNRVATQATQDVIERLRANRPVAPVNADPSVQPALDKAHGESIGDLQRTLLSMTPETSMNRLMAHRQNVQGFSKDMLASQRYAADMTAFSLARRSLSHEVSAAEAGMLKDVENANGRADVPLNTKLGLADTVGELMHGQRLRQTYTPKDWKDAVRQFTNFLHIGMSPAYFPMQMSQLAITGAPELAKLSGSGLRGYGSAFAAMQQSVTPAMKALAAIARSPEGLTAGMTLEALKKTTLDPATINTLMGMELRGALGSYTASVSEHPALTDTMLKAANTLGMYSDLAPRIIMGLAADKLYTAKYSTKPHPTMTREQFIDRAIGDSQGYYSTALGARQMSRSGTLLGSFTPMTMQFQTWNINLTNKIYREVHDAFKGEDAQTKKDARTWLAGHAAAVVALTGTLGLPAVSVAASVYDKLADWFTNRDDHDVIASYRGFLANTFGKDMGEVIARGLPRRAGMDFANWGEGEIIPGTASLKIFTEKRKWEDVEKDWFKSMGGPALDQAFQLKKAADDITNGDYLEGLGRMSPGLISGPLKAYRLAKEGFVDQHGQKLPLSSPNAAQIMLTMLGLKSAGQAEYQEVAREVSGLRAMREASSANISQHLRQAYVQGDQGAFNSWMAEAARWQVQHPGFVPPQISFQRTLNTHLQQLSQAKGMGLPIGVRPQDVGPRGTFSYANIPVQ